MDHDSGAVDQPVIGHRSTVSVLIERLEKLSGSDGETDARIWFVTDRAAASRCFWNAAPGLPKPIPENLPSGLGRNAVIANTPRYTASLDAALTLVPEGYTWSVDTHDRVEGNPDGWAWANVLTPNAFSFVAHRSTAPTPAIALCIAALKAREAMA